MCRRPEETFFQRRHIDGTWKVLNIANQRNANQNHNEGFPGGAVVENPPANAGDMGSIPGPGRSHMPRSN